VEVIIIIILGLISQYAIGNYFAAKSYEIIKKFDFYKDNEIMEEIGIAYDENLVYILEEKKGEKFLIFQLLTVAFVLMIITIMYFSVFLEFSSSVILFGAVIVFLFALLVVFDKWLTLKEFIKLKDNDYRIALEKERKMLEPIRIFFCFSNYNCNRYCNDM